MRAGALYARAEVGGSAYIWYFRVCFLSILFCFLLCILHMYACLPFSLLPPSVACPHTNSYPSIVPPPLFPKYSLPITASVLLLRSPSLLFDHSLTSHIVALSPFSPKLPPRFVLVPGLAAASYRFFVPRTIYNNNSWFLA
jgi:hypothetical protein